MTARVTAENYGAMKGFCFWFWQQQSAEWERLGIPADQWPGEVVAAFERKSPAIARESVREGIGDIIEETQTFEGEKLRTIDTALTAEGLPTLSEVRLQFWGRIHGILRRGRVRSETEYDALRNVVEAMPREEQSNAWALLGAFETREGR